MKPSNLTQRILALIYAFAVTTALTGCGGGGGEGSSSNDGINAAGDTNTGADEIVKQGLDDLNIDQDNKLVSVSELEVMVQINSRRSFLNICAQEVFQSDLDQIDYERCILRAPLDDTPGTFKLTLPNHIDKLIAIVWFYEADKQPLVKKWQRNSDAGGPVEETWRVTDNG